jgi:small RNA 2'-O-methyltransferase
MFIFENSNPQWSFVLGKNPSSGLTVDSFRKGNFWGFFKNEQTFCITFLDGIFENSFAKTDDVSGDYLNHAKFDSRDLLYNVIQHVFTQNVSRISEYDEISENKLYWAPVLLSAKSVRDLQVYLKHMGITFRHEAMTQLSLFTLIRRFVHITLNKFLIC